MPRQARKHSESGIYHVMLRGISQQQIFEDAEDDDKFIQILKESKAVSEFKLFAYCLINNHIHLLIKPEKEPIEQVFKRIGARYVYWFNGRTRRTPHDSKNHTQQMKVNLSIYCVFQNAFSIYGGLSR